MSNHIHVIWQVEDSYNLSDVQLSFMKYMAQMMLKELRNNHPKVWVMFKVKAADRKYQVWERNPLSVSLFNRVCLNRNWITFTKTRYGQVL